MARKRTAKHPKPAGIEPEDESQEELEATAPDEQATLSKAEAVRRALAAGKESPDEGVAFIRERFGIDIAKPHFSAQKSQIKKREAKAAPAGRPGRKPRQVAETGHVAPAMKPSAVSADNNMIDDLAAVKHLVQRLGADQVRKIVGLFE